MGRVHRIRCDYGTDCSDCAPLAPREPLARLEEMMPTAPAELRDEKRVRRRRRGGDSQAVRELRKRNVQINAAWTRTQPPFIMTFTDPAHDVDVSRAMQSGRSVEALYNLYWRRLSEQCCAKGGLMLDVGANFGYYSLFAAKMGCRVVAWEPVPAFRAFVEAAARLNNVSHRINLRPHVVSDVAGRVVNMTVPLSGIWGTASVDGLNVDPSIPSKKYQVSARTETLDQVVSETPCIMKLDVEGYEPSVLKGATRRFLRQHAPAAILTEYTPGVMERARQWHRLPEYPQSLQSFADAGYAIWHLVGVQKNAQQVMSMDWAAASLPALAEVTSRSLRAEALNARNMVADNSGERAPGFSIPWDLHPKSLHAEFSHNTDLLLTLNRTAVRPMREVGVDAASEFGLGGGLCAHVLRDGTPNEMVGRLCVTAERAQAISRATEIAEAPRPLRKRQSWHAGVGREARKWKIEGRHGTKQRRLVAAEGGGAAADNDIVSRIRFNRERAGRARAAAACAAVLLAASPVHAKWLDPEIDEAAVRLQRATVRLADVSQPVVSSCSSVYGSQQPVACTALAKASQAAEDASTLDSSLQQLVIAATTITAKTADTINGGFGDQARDVLLGVDLKNRNKIKPALAEYRAASASLDDLRAKQKAGPEKCYTAGCYVSYDAGLYEKKDKDMGLVKIMPI